MPTPERMLALLRRAIENVKATTGRRGHVVDLVNVTDLLVVGDLHGHMPNFQAVWKLADLAKNPGRHLVVQELIHGPFAHPGGGEKSHQLVDLFAVAKTQFPDRVHYLPGNHEMGQWTGRKILKGEADLNEQFRRGVQSTYGTALMPEIYRAYLELFQCCPFVIRTPNGVGLSHTLPPLRQLPLFELRMLETETFAEKELQPGGIVYGILWGRDTSEEAAAEFLRRIECDWLITGHIPADAGFTVPNARQITLDCSNTPGGYVFFPCDRPLTWNELHGCVATV